MKIENSISDLEEEFSDLYFQYFALQIFIKLI